MFEGITRFFKNLAKTEKDTTRSKDAAKERLHLVLMQDRANVSADFLDLMKQEIIEVIKKYIDIDENAMDVRLTNKQNDDGTTGAPALYANIPIMTIKDEARKQAKVITNEKNEQARVDKEEEQPVAESNNEKVTESEEVKENDVVEKNESEEIENNSNIENDEDTAEDDIIVDKEDVEQENESEQVMVNNESDNENV